MQVLTGASASRANGTWRLTGPQLRVTAASPGRVAFELDVAHQHTVHPLIFRATSSVF
jgi:hypothetical protein